MTKERVKSIIGGTLLVLAFAACIFAAAFFVSSFIYHTLGLHPSAFFAQMITSLLGLFFGILILSSLSHIFKSKQWAVYGPIIEALERIAKGDFSVRLATDHHDHGLITELTTSVNNMALELTELEKMRQEFISNVSHEIQSPLTSIRGFAQALQNDHLPPDERHHYLSIIETESTRLSRITENLLRLASLESQQVKYEPKLYRLDRQIRDLILVCEPQWTNKNLDMDVALEEIEITADQDLLSQVWINLISNSIKFTPSGGCIAVDVRQQENAVKFTIHNTGIGISEADQMHIFERFYKVDKSRTHANNGGSGLGLSIVQKIVELHHGTISVESQPDTGTTFAVFLPLR